MRKPKTNPAIEAIKARLKKEYLPSGNIPNSRIAKQIDLIEATATLEFAKSQNRKVRRARPGECEATRDRAEKPNIPRIDPNKPDGMLSTREAAEKIGISPMLLQHYKKTKEVTGHKVGSRIYYSESEILKIKVSRLKTA